MEDLNPRRKLQNRRARISVIFVYNVAPATSWIAPLLELRHLTVTSHLEGLPVGVLYGWISDVLC